jgi:glycosyltransferase involved in cell wall biosynthesis
MVDNVDSRAVGDVDISVVLACYTEKRLPSIRAALTSLRKQSLEARKVVVAVDNNEPLAGLLADEFDWVTVVLNTAGRGASVTRNRGVECVDTEYTAFLDDDETAEPDWLVELARPFVDADVVGTGGKYEPDWMEDRCGFRPSSPGRWVGPTWDCPPSPRRSATSGRGTWPCVRNSSAPSEGSAPTSGSGAASPSPRTPIYASGYRRRPEGTGCTCHPR